MKELAKPIAKAAQDAKKAMSSLFTDLWVYLDLANGYLFDILEAVKRSRIDEDSLSDKIGISVAKNVPKAVLKAEKPIVNVNCEPNVTVDFPNEINVARPKWIEQLIPKEKPESEEPEDVIIKNDKPIEVRVVNPHEFPAYQGGVKYMGGGSPSQLKDVSGNIINFAFSNY